MKNEEKNKSAECWQLGAGDLRRAAGVNHSKQMAGVVLAKLAGDPMGIGSRCEDISINFA
jgi:hypothetical protein